MVLYEYPFNEGIRTMLRLEHLFDRLGQLLPRDAPVDHHFALFTLFEIMDVASRADLKSDLLKELERHKSQLAAYRGNAAVSQAAKSGDATSHMASSCPSPQADHQLASGQGALTASAPRAAGFSTARASPAG